MNLEAYDFLLAGSLAVLLPFFGVWQQRRWESRRLVDPSGARLDAYLLTMIVEWGLVLTALSFWFLRGRDLEALGLGFETGTGAWIGTGLGLAVCAALFAQTVAVLRRPEALRSVRRQVEPLESLVPRDAREARAFAALSVTAGLCEELLYRGFLLAMLTPLVGGIAAVVLSSLAFGVGHAYQGARGVAKTTLVGLALAGLVLLTGSLWVPMLVHAVLDLNAGFLGRRALEGPAAPEVTATAG
jgi:membrane protease YdiL (CAAX protease family)